MYNQSRLMSVLGLVLLCLAAVPSRAEEIKLKHNDLTLNANLELATGKAIADGVILMTHSGLAHGRMETMAYLQQLLKDAGYSSMAITLSFGISDRHGMLNCKSVHRHQFADGADEIGAWLNWLRQKGAKKVALLGHSRGAGHTALFAAESDSDLVKAVVLLAPDTRATNDAAAYERAHGQPLAPVLKIAQKQVAAGKGNTVLDHTGILYCRDTSVSAKTIVSYYGPDPRLDTPYLVRKIAKPVLIVIAGSDELVVGFRDSFVPLADGKRVQLKVIEGAGHFLRDLYSDDAVDAIRAFLPAAGY